ncbi:MAG: hypothetical protein HYU66_09265 [Armatimonadetes bacterium]|nr:hypothetical protein [Armatimonadota bacterium]
MPRRAGDTHRSEEDVMLGFERFAAALSHREGDRVPIYCWIFGQPGVTDDIHARFGDMDHFADALDFDLVQAFPAGGLLTGEAKAGYDTGSDPTFGNVLDVADACEVPLTDPHDDAIYGPIRRAVEHDRGRRGRAVLVQTPGVFEAANGFIGLENHLLELALRPELCARLYDRIAEWSCAYIDHCVDLGVDCIHVSDDWGMNGGLLFRKATWEEHIRPATARIAAKAKSRGAWLSLHSDGDVTDVLGETADLGFDVVHPVQESAGMDMLAVKQRYRGRLALYGGLDIRTVLGRGMPQQVEDEVRRLMRTLKPGGGYVFCTSHMVQPGTPLDEVIHAYEVAREEGVY